MPRHLPPGPANGVTGRHHARALQTDLLGFVTRLQAEYGDAVYFRVATTPFYQFTHPDHVREVLVTKAKKLVKPRRLKQVFGKWDGQGLVTSDGDLWVRQRRLVQRAFPPARLERYAEVMSRHAWEWFGRWPARFEGNISEVYHQLTVEIVSEALFGARLDGVSERLKSAVDAIQEFAMRDFSATVPTPLWWNRLFDPQAYAAIQMLDDLVWKMIRERRAAGEDRGDLLSILLLAVDDEGDGGGMSDRQARDELMTLLLAGHESTAVTLTWTTYLLAKHPEIQDEIAGVVRHELQGRAPQYADLPKFARLEQAIKEAMRLYPAVYFISREAAEPVEISGYALPRGAQIHLVPYLMFHDERWWPDPERFDPDRFSPAREGEIREFTYFPFGAGPRACIGKTFAMIEAQLILASLLSRYRLSLPAGAADPAIETQVSLHPRGGLPIVAEKLTDAVPV